MRKTIIAFCALTAFALFTACSPDVEDVFGDSAANRMADKQNSYYDILESQEQGWALDFYPSDRSLGGVAYTARFKDGEVAMACEQPIANSVSGKTYPVGTEVSSFYKIKDETSVLLTFDTYNPLFHYWSQPVPGRAKGFLSDYEFTFISASADSVVLRGKKYGNLLKMVPLKESAATYVKKVRQVHSALSKVIRKRAVVDGVSQRVTMAYNLFIYQGAAKTDTVAFIHTDSGIRFYQPVVLGGVAVSQLSYNSSADELRSADGRVALPTPTVAERFAGGSTQWYFDYDFSTGPHSMCDELKGYFKSAAAKIAEPDWGFEVMKEVYIGANLVTSDAQHVVIGWKTQNNYGTGDAHYFGYSVSMDLLDDSRQLISIQPHVATTDFNQHCQSTIDFIGRNSPYLMVFDNDQQPTSVTLTSERDNSKWFRLKLK